VVSGLRQKCRKPETFFSQSSVVIASEAKQPASIFSFRHFIASEAIPLHQMKLVANSNTKKIYIKGGK